MRSLEINLISRPPIPGFPGISTCVVRTHYLGLSVLPGRSSVIWRELKKFATTESNTSYIGTHNSMKSHETWSWDLMRLGLIESHENSHLTRVILKKISISRKHMRGDWDPTLDLRVKLGSETRSTGIGIETLYVELEVGINMSAS
jgi:hypothetical protein